MSLRKITHGHVLLIKHDSWPNWDKCNVLKITINYIKVSYIIPFAGGVSTLGTYGIFSSGAVFLGTSGTSKILIIIELA